MSRELEWVCVFLPTVKGQGYSDYTMSVWNDVIRLSLWTQFLHTTYTGSVSKEFRWVCVSPMLVKNLDHSDFNMSVRKQCHSKITFICERELRQRGDLYRRWCSCSNIIHILPRCFPNRLLQIYCMWERVNEGTGFIWEYFPDVCLDIMQLGDKHKASPLIREISGEFPY